MSELYKVGDVVEITSLSLADIMGDIELGTRATILGEHTFVSGREGYKVSFEDMHPNLKDGRSYILYHDQVKKVGE